MDENIRPGHQFRREGTTVEEAAAKAKMPVPVPKSKTYMGVSFSYTRTKNLRQAKVVG